MIAYPSRFSFSFVIIPIMLLVGLTLACELDIEFGDDGGPSSTVTATESPAATTTAVPNTAAAPTPTVSLPTSSASPTATAAPGPTVTPVPAPIVFPGCSSDQRVELSVLVEPLDSGNVEIAGSEILTNGGATPVCKDDQMNIIARPNDGWRFDHWELDVTGTRPTMVIVMTGSRKIRAVFVPISEEPKVPTAFYKLTVNGIDVRNSVIALDNGSIAISPPPGAGESPYPEDTIVVLAARPNEGFSLKRWDGDCTGIAPCVLTMDGNKSADAIFGLKSFDLTATVTPANGGSVSPAGTTSHFFGSEIEVTYEANEGFEFIGWSEACVGSGLCTIIMNHAKTVQAGFKLKRYTLIVTAQPSEGGSVTLAGATVYDHGSQVVLTAQPAVEYF